MTVNFRQNRAASYRKVSPEPIAPGRRPPGRSDSHRRFTIVPLQNAAKRLRPPQIIVNCLQLAGRYYLSCRAGLVTPGLSEKTARTNGSRTIQHRCQMTSIADRVADPSLAGAAETILREAAPAISLPLAGER